MANPVQINDSLFTAGLVLSAQEARTGLSALVARDGAGARLGVFYEGSQSLIAGTATTTPSMQVSVSPLAFCGQKASGEGVYVGRSVGTVLVDIAAAPASNSRIDVVYVMQRDANSTTSPDSVTQGEVGVVTGTAAVSPTKPAIPAGAVEVGTVTVSSGVTATTNAGVTIATTCTWTAAAGSPIPVVSQAQRDALSKFVGLQVKRLDGSGAVQTWKGSVWDPDPLDTGWVALTLNSGGVAGTFTAVTGYPLQYRQVGNRVWVRGMVTFSTNNVTNVMTTLPAAATPAQSTWLDLTIGGGTNYIMQILVSSSGTIQIPSSYYTGTAATGMQINVTGTFLID